MWDDTEMTAYFTRASHLAAATVSRIEDGEVTDLYSTAPDIAAEVAQMLNAAYLKGVEDTAREYDRAAARQRHPANNVPSTE